MVSVSSKHLLGHFLSILIDCNAPWWQMVNADLPTNGDGGKDPQKETGRDNLKDDDGTSGLISPPQPPPLCLSSNYLTCNCLIQSPIFSGSSPASFDAVFLITSIQEIAMIPDGSPRSCSPADWLDWQKARREKRIKQRKKIPTNSTSVLGKKLWSQGKNVLLTPQNFLKHVNWKSWETSVA